MVNWELVWLIFFLFGAGGLSIVILLVLSSYFQRSHQLRRSRVMLYLSISLALSLVIAFSSVIVTTRNEFCASCHEMQPYTEAFKKSVHSELSCFGCHGGQGFVDFASRKIALVRESYHHLTGSYAKPINSSGKLSKEMNDNICGRCHDLEKRKVTARKDLIIDHNKHRRKKISCTVCHNRVAHPNVKLSAQEGSTPLPDDLKQVAGFEKEKFYPNRMKMRYCMKCHTGESAKRKAAKECKTCHPDKYIKPPKNHEIAGFLRPSSEPNSQVTQIAYAEPKAKKRALHAKMASFDKGYCQSCHDRKFCFNCHKMKMPHPKAKWNKEHGKIGQASPEKCHTCHGKASFCDACHHNYNPMSGPWLSETQGQSYHPVKVRERGAESCFQCHQVTYCAHCHVTASQE